MLKFDMVHKNIEINTQLIYLSWPHLFDGFIILECNSEPKIKKLKQQIIWAAYKMSPNASSMPSWWQRPFGL